MACTQEIYCSKWDCDKLGIAALILGPIGLVLGGACVTWLANHAIFFAWFFSIREPKIFLVFSSLALAIGLNFMFFDEILRSEAGHYEKIISYQIGYYLWILSFLIMSHAI